MEANLTKGNSTYVIYSASVQDSDSGEDNDKVRTEEA